MTSIRLYLDIDANVLHVFVFRYDIKGIWSTVETLYEVLGTRMDSRYKEHWCNKILKYQSNFLGPKVQNFLFNPDITKFRYNKGNFTGPKEFVITRVHSIRYFVLSVVNTIWSNANWSHWDLRNFFISGILFYQTSFRVSTVWDLSWNTRYNKLYSPVPREIKFAAYNEENVFIPINSEVPLLHYGEPGYTGYFFIHKRIPKWGIYRVLYMYNFYM